MYIYHKKASSVPNPADATKIGGDDWNDSHTVYGANPVVAGYVNPQNLGANDNAITGGNFSAYSASNTLSINMNNAGLTSISRLVCIAQAWSATELYDVRATFIYPSARYDMQGGYELKLSFFTRAGVAVTPTSVHFVVFKV